MTRKPYEKPRVKGEASLHVPMASMPPEVWAHKMGDAIYGAGLMPRPRLLLSDEQLREMGYEVPC